MTSNYVYEYSIMKINKFDGGKDMWVKLLSDFNNYSICQTWTYGEYVVERGGKIVRYLFTKSGEVVGVCQVETNGFFARWIEGPLIIENKNYRKNLLNAISLMKKELKVKNLCVTENCSLPLEVGSDEFEIPEMMVSKWATFLINFKGLTSDDIWNKFDNSVRKNVKKCDELDVVVKRINDEEIDKYYLPILAEHRKRMGFEMPFVYPQQQLWSKFKNEGVISETFVAFRNEVPISGLGVLATGGKIKEFAVAQSEVVFTDKIPAQDLIKWEIVKWGIEQKEDSYDLSGVSPNPTDDKEKGIRKFKEKFAGDYYEYMVVNSKMNNILRKPLILLSIFKKFLKI